MYKTKKRHFFEIAGLSVLVIALSVGVAVIVNNQATLNNSKAYEADQDSFGNIIRLNKDLSEKSTDRKYTERSRKELVEPTNTPKAGMGAQKVLYAPVPVGTPAGTPAGTNAPAPTTLPQSNNPNCGVAGGCAAPCSAGGSTRDCFCTTTNCYENIGGSTYRFDKAALNKVLGLGYSADDLKGKNLDDMLGGLLDIYKNSTDPNAPKTVEELINKLYLENPDSLADIYGNGMGVTEQEILNYLVGTMKMTALEAKNYLQNLVNAVTPVSNGGVGGVPAGFTLKYPSCGKGCVGIGTKSIDNNTGNTSQGEGEGNTNVATQSVPSSIFGVKVPAWVTNFGSAYGTVIKWWWESLNN